jgi:hypothetical protein
MLAAWYMFWYKIYKTKICTKALEIANIPLKMAVSGRINEVATGIPSFTPIISRVDIRLPKSKSIFFR